MAVGALACSSILGIDYERSRNDDGGGGNGGRDAGAAGAGHAGMDDGQGGKSTGGTGPGRGGHDAGSAGSGAGGTAGAGDDGGATGEAGAATVGPTLNEPCSEEGARSCTDASPLVVLTCGTPENDEAPDGERRWLVSHTCPATARCDPATASCRNFAGICARDARARCEAGGGLVDCASNPFEPETHRCPFGCLDGACVPPEGNFLTVHTEVRTTSGNFMWPGDIPVCFENGGSTAAVRRVIREAVEEAWSRSVDVDFTGFGTCEEPATGVVIEFFEDCRGRLGSGVDQGYRGEGTTSRVGICLSYVDARGELRRMDEDEELLRFVARHQFGHVLGLLDEPRGDTVMLRGIEHPGAEKLQPSFWDLSALRTMYGAKPSASLITPAGRCLAAANGLVEVARCALVQEQAWILALNEALQLGGDACLASPNAEGAIALGGCSPFDDDVSWTMPLGQWRLLGGCFVPRSTPARVGDSVVVAKCGAVGDPATSWSFEIYDAESLGYLARIRHAGSGLCATIPDAISSGGMPVLLDTCGRSGRVDQLFYLRPGGEIGFLGNNVFHCLAVDGPESQLYLWLCGFIHWRNTFMVTGAIESSTGLRLEATPDADGELVGAVPALGPPEPHQIFDWYF